MAAIVIWIGYLQWKHRSVIPFEDEIPILQPLDQIELRDAILDLSDPNHPGVPDWPEADVIVGNPPFLGGSLLRKHLGREYVEALFSLYGDRLPNFSDLCCYWFEQARGAIADGRATRAGLLATQGIRGGANRRVLERIKETGDIFFAYSDRPWILDGAAVHVSMVGFDNGSEAMRTLDDQAVPAINSNLTAGVDATKARRLRENLGLSFKGPAPHAPFDIPADLAKRMLTAPVNPNGRPNRDMVRPVASAIDLTRRPRGMWTIDFALMPESEAALYEMPFEYVKENVLPVRSTRRDDYRGQWWQYARPRPEMRQAIARLKRCIVTPHYSKYRLFFWVSTEVLCNNLTIVFARDDDYFFGVLHSRVHEVWARATGTQLREVQSGFRYTSTSCFETFPLPCPSAEQEAAIAEAARELDQLRQTWLNPPEDSIAPSELKKRTLTNLYNKRPTWLANAHRDLDAAVFAAYGWPEPPDKLSDAEIVTRLLQLNLQREPA
jgi:type II restriction/modification system DNA methylase subunit YeeA